MEHKSNYQQLQQFLQANAFKHDKLSHSFHEEKFWFFLYIVNFLMMMTFKRILLSEFKYFWVPHETPRNGDVRAAKELLSQVFFLKFNNKL